MRVALRLRSPKESFGQGDIANKLFSEDVRLSGVEALILILS